MPDRAEAAPFSPPTPATGPDTGAEKKPQPRPGVCALIRQYGLVFLFGFFALWCVTFVVVLSVVRAGLDTIGLLEWIGVHKLFGWPNVRSQLNPRWGELGVAYMVTGFTEPVRIAICVFLAPPLDRWVRNTFPRFSARFLPAPPPRSPDLHDAEASGVAKQS